MSLDEDALAVLLAGGWSLAQDEGVLSKRFQFSDFIEAFGWMTQVAMEAEKLNHHPDWSNSYRQVEVRLTTHDTGGLSNLDLELAARMDELAGDLPA